MNARQLVEHACGLSSGVQLVEAWGNTRLVPSFREGDLVLQVDGVSDDVRDIGVLFSVIVSNNPSPQHLAREGPFYSLRYLTPGVREIGNTVSIDSDYLARYFKLATKADVKGKAKAALGEDRYFRANAHPVLPVGQVSLYTGGISQAEWHHWSKIWDCWPHEEGADLLLRQRQQPKFAWQKDDPVSLPKWYVVHTSADVEVASERYGVGQELFLCHDQSSRPIGDTVYGWELVGLYPHTDIGLRSMARDSHMARLPFSTFK